MFRPEHRSTKTTVHGCVRVLIGGMVLLASLAAAQSALSADIGATVRTCMMRPVFRAQIPSHGMRFILPEVSHTIKASVHGNVMPDFGGTARCAQIALPLHVLSKNIVLSAEMTRIRLVYRVRDQVIHSLEC